MGIVLGTAGHIDHGKTALVKALTGVDTDRLREEKDRGISIDLGFTALDLPGLEEVVGVVDVPGHERFVKNMLAGAAGIDLVLLVVASDEGVMPQTREHMQICLLLGIERAVVAMTKTDLAEPELAEAAVEDVREFLAGTPYETSPIVRVSSATGQGLDELREALAGQARAISQRRPGGAFRMPIDRAFTMEGFGTVVTGTTWSGRVKAGDPLEIMPAGMKTRVRTIQVHGAETQEIGPGHRTAIALHAVHKEAAGRGQWAVAPKSFSRSHMLDVSLSLTQGADKPLKTRSRVRFHLGSSEIMARIVLLEGDLLEPGETALAQLRLEAPAVAARGDKFVIRSYSPARTVGGGIVLVPVAGKHRRRDRESVESLARQAAAAPGEDLREVISRAGPQGASLDTISREMGMEIADLRELAEGSAGLRPVGADRFVTSEVFDRTTAELASWIAGYQRSHPLRWGLPKGELRSKAKAARIGDALFEASLRSLRDEGRLHARGDRLRVDSPAPEPDAAARAKLDEIESIYREAGSSPPTVKELGAGRGMGLDAKALVEALEYLAMEGRLVKLTADMYFHAEAMGAIRALVARYFEDKERLTVPEFKDLVGASRKFAVPLLEYLDRTGLTRRVGDYRAPGRLLRDEAVDEGKRGTRTSGGPGGADNGR